VNVERAQANLDTAATNFVKSKQLRGTGRVVKQNIYGMELLDTALDYAIVSMGGQTYKKIMAEVALITGGPK
jgi:hypothetical protein